MRLIDADRFYINYARRFSREPLKVEIFKQFIDAEPTVCDIEQIRDKAWADAALAENERLRKAIDIIRAEIEQLHCHPKLDFIKNDEVVDMALDVIDKYR